MLLGHFIQKALESWVERGRHRDVIAEDGRFVLRFGSRYRGQLVFFLGVCIVLFVGGLAAMLMGVMGNVWVEFACFTLVAGMALVFVFFTTYALTSRVDIDDAEVSVRCFGMTISTCRSGELASAYKAPVHESVVLRRRDGGKTRISTHFDGLKALVAWLWLQPDAVLTDSIRQWMLVEAPEFGEPSPESRGWATGWQDADAAVHAGHQFVAGREEMQQIHLIAHESLHPLPPTTTTQLISVRLVQISVPYLSGSASGRIRRFQNRAHHQFLAGDNWRNVVDSAVPQGEVEHAAVQMDRMEPAEDRCPRALGGRG